MAGLTEMISKYDSQRIGLTTPSLTTCRYVHRDSEELAQLKEERRKGRPPSKREEALGQRTDTEVKEFKTGFWVPDLTDMDVLLALKHWNGQWSGLSTLKFVRLVEGGEKQDSTFPPKGMS